MTKVCFFNFYHNGDIFHSKPFVREVIELLGKENILYAHYKDHAITNDLDIQMVRLEGMSDKTKILRIKEPDMILVNTWIGSYFDKYAGECTLNFNMKMWADIYEYINATFNTNMKLGPVENYLPFVDYSKYDVSHVNAYLDSDDKKKILFCNGPALSGQSEYNTDMDEIIRPLAIHNPDKTFITTHKIFHDLPNIIYSSDITKIQGNDLSQIAYVAKYCNLVIGRNSGPFCFASTGENLNDPSKMFYAFGHQESDCFSMGITKKSKYVFENTRSPDTIYESIKTLIGEM